MRVIHASSPKTSEFASILETLDNSPESADVPHGGPGGHVRPDAAAQGKDWLLQLIDSFSATVEPVRAKDLTATLYAEAMAEQPPPPPRPQLPDDQPSVAAELALRPEMSEEELRHIRRAFALANHPDRLLPEERARATRRMTLANMLIDAHLKRTAGAH